MISFNSLGNLGRLGNQMFQYASLKGIARHRGMDFCIPPEKIFGHVDVAVRNSDTNLYDCFNLQHVNQNICNYTRLIESTFCFDENLYNTCPSSVDLFGYFQTEKYFKEIESEIREDFKFKEEIHRISKETFTELFSNQKVISLHIRRGDYLTNLNHPVQSLKYYENALSYFDDDIPVIIFSDDPYWCNDQQLFESDRFIISYGQDTKIDLCLMTMCSYHIIANSSFSWWGSYLANSEKTIAPKLWFGDELSKVKSTQDLYLNNWIVI
jgi:hypothetical protein